MKTTTKQTHLPGHETRPEHTEGRMRIGNTKFFRQLWDQHMKEGGLTLEEYNDGVKCIEAEEAENASNGAR